MNFIAELRRRNVIRMAVHPRRRRCFPIHDAGPVRLPYDRAMDPLRDDPRFAALVQKMGFPK